MFISSFVSCRVWQKCWHHRKKASSYLSVYWCNTNYPACICRHQFCWTKKQLNSCDFYCTPGKVQNAPEENSQSLLLTVKTWVIFSVCFGGNTLWQTDMSAYLHACVLSDLGGPGDHSRWEAMILPPVGYLVVFPDRLAGGAHPDTMFYWLRGCLDIMGGLFELWAQMGVQTHITHAGVTQNSDAIIMSTSFQCSTSIDDARPPRSERRNCAYVHFSLGQLNCKWIHEIPQTPLRLLLPPCHFLSLN